MQTLIFLHLPKTGGSTLGLILRRQYKATEVYVCRRRKHELVLENLRARGLDPAAIKLYIGHMPFGLHERLPQPCQYFTILRDPVERVISDYHFILRYQEHRKHEQVLEADLSFVEFLAQNKKSESDNAQTRNLAGAARGIGPASPEMLAAAKENLTKHFSVVGVTERFDETLVLLSDTYGWKSLYYSKINITPGRPSREDFPPKTLELLREQEHYDLDLYQHANELLDREITQIPDFEGKLQKFRQRNGMLGGMVTLYQRAALKGRSLFGLDSKG